MEAIYLQSMTDQIEDIENYVHESHNKERGFDLIKNYKDFLKQPLKLGFFVPCDENGNVLNEITYLYSVWKNLKPKEQTEYKNRCEIYKKAKERVLFKVEYKTGICNNKPAIWINGRGAQIIEDFKFLTIEDLAHWNFELSETAIKQIGL